MVYYYGRLINKVKFGISDTEKGILSKKMSIIFKNFLIANINTTNNRTSSFVTINESPQINTIKIPSRSKKELFLEKISQISNDKRNKYYADFNNKHPRNAIEFSVIFEDIDLNEMDAISRDITQVSKL